MADPQFTQAERDALLDYRKMRRGDQAQQVGVATGNSGRILQGKDPLYSYSRPGADNLTEEQKAKLRAQYAEILAKLAQAEREAQSSDQDYASKVAITRNDIIKALIQSRTDLGVADKNLAQARIDELGKVELASIDQWQKAQSALTLTPAGQAMVGDVQKQVLSTGVLNATATLQTINGHLGELAKTNPAQIPAYLRSVNEGFRASGRPEYRDFDVEALLTKMDPNDPGQVTLVQQIAGQIQRGDAAAQTQAVLYDQGKQQQEQVRTEIKKTNGDAPRDLRDFTSQLVDELSADTTKDMAPQIKAPPVDASPDAKRAYVERATGGKQTLNEQGNVVNPGGGGPATSYDGFIQAYPGIHADGVAQGGGMTPSGGSYARSGPTQETIESIRKLRGQIETQISNLDNVNLDPMTLAKQRAQAALAESGQAGSYRNPDFALRAAERTARAENRLDYRADRAQRDAAVQSGAEIASEREKFAAGIRQGARGLMDADIPQLSFRALRRQAGGGGEAPAPGTSSATADLDLVTDPTPPNLPAGTDAAHALEGAKRAMAAGESEDVKRYLGELMWTAKTPKDYRDAAALYDAIGDKGMAGDANSKADDLEYKQESAARRQSRPDDGKPWDTSLRIPRPSEAAAARAQQMLETDPTIPDGGEDWSPQVPGRENRTPQVGRDFQRAEGDATLADKTGKDPLSSVYTMGGDFGATANANRMAGSQNPEVPFERTEPERPPLSMRARATPVASGAESTGGDAATGEKESSASDVAKALSEVGKPTERPAEKKREPVEFGPTEARLWRNFIQTSDELLGQQNAPDAAAPAPAPVEAADAAAPYDPGLSLRRRQRSLVDGVGQ